MSISERLGFVRYRWKGKQIADALVPLRVEALTCIYAALTEAGRDSIRFFPDPSDEVFLKAYQTLCYCTMFSQHPEYVRSADRDLLLGCIAISAKRDQNVTSTLNILMTEFDSLDAAGMSIAALFWGLEKGEICNEPQLRLVATQIQIIGLSTQQVVALAFKDQKSVLELQTQKLKILEQLN